MMRSERSAGAVVFRRDGSIKFLLLHYGKGHWGFPKGHVEQGETEEQAMLRELAEETGISAAEVIPGFLEEMEYSFRERSEIISKTVSFRLLESRESEVTLSREHSEFEWLAFEEAFSRLTFTNAKELLRKASDFIQAANQNNK